MRWRRKKKPGFALESVFGRLDDVFLPECRVELIDGSPELGEVIVHFSTADQVAFLRVHVDPSLYDLFVSYLGEPAEFGLTVASSGSVEIT